MKSSLKNQFSLTRIMLLATIFLLPLGISAQQTERKSAFRGMLDFISPIGEEAYGYRNGVPTDIRAVVSMIIRVIIMVLIIVFFVLVVYGGYTWMMARGEEEKVNKGKAILSQGTIGIVIIFSAWAITAFILRAAVCATNEYSEWCLFFAGIT